MKKIIASAGLVAVGASSLHAVNYGDITPETANKRWSVSAAVRGFYDDNYTTRPSGEGKEGSLGFEVVPSINLNMPMETSFLGLGYTYGMSYYADRSDDKIDQFHDARFNFDHRFSERAHFNFLDQFVYSIEPTILGTGATPLRADAEAVHNRAVLSFDTMLTRQWSLLFAYENNYWNYQDDGPGSYSALLDRDENLFRLDPRYQLNPNTKLYAGYQFGYNDYLSSEALAPGSAFTGQDRDNTSQYGYVGADHQFSSVLTAEGRVGIQYFNYHELDQDNLGPYVDLIGTYNYQPGSYLKFGLRQAHNATDIGTTAGSTNPNDVTLDQDTTTVYLSATHRLTPLITANALAQYQHSIYDGGDVDGEADDYVTFGVTLAYKLDQHWSIEANYSLDWLDSDIEGRSFTRNRVSLGARATY